MAKFAFFILFLLSSLLADVNAQNWCDVSGFSIQENLNSSVIARLNNDTLRRYASLGFLIKDDNNYGVQEDSIEVYDYNLNKYIKAKNAYFVQSKMYHDIFFEKGILAFSQKDDALKFAKEKKGKILSFDEVMKNAKANYKKNEQRLKELIRKRYQKIGKKVYEKKCKDIDISEFFEINELKDFIYKSRICGKLNELYLQSLALFLWQQNEENIMIIEVDENAKCPVCGMFVAKYPKWVGQIFYKSSEVLNFDGVKDLMKFYFNPSKWGKYDYATKENIDKILITDYYTQKAINAKEAFFVIRSNVFGPMGNELIPFVSEDDAKNFVKDHGGKKILKFDEIKENLPYELDYNE